MKILYTLSATLLAVLFLCFGPLPGYASADSGKNDVTLVYDDGHEVSYSLDTMHSQVKGKTVLLRDSCMDHLAGCDMTTVYEAMDFAVLNGAIKIKVPLTSAQLRTIENVWLHDDFFEQLFPGVSQRVFQAELSSDGRYLIRIGLAPFGYRSSVEDTIKYGEAMVKKHLAGRDKAMQIVASIPKSCDTAYKKMEYLYNYLTNYVIYYDFEKHGDNYWDSGDLVNLIYDALLRNETVCAGYAYTFAYLCELAGIDAQYVTVWTGNSSDPSHQVTIVEIDGKNYWFDATWDAGKNKSGFQYFGLSDSEFAKVHTYNKTFYARSNYPSCGSTLRKPTGYWDFNTKTYQTFGWAGLNDANIKAGRYSITTALDSGKVLEVDGYSMESGGNVQIYDNVYIDFQKFDVSKDSKGYIFKNCGSSLILDVQNGYGNPGDNVWQYESNSTAAQRWQIYDAGNGYCYIKSTLGEVYLEVAGSSTANNTNVRIASFTGNNNQKWKFTPVGQNDANIKAGRYSITTALDSGKVLEVDGYSMESGGNVQIYDNVYIDFQKFDVSKDSKGYIFKNCGSSLILDVQNGYGNPGDNVWQYESNSTAAQRWQIYDAGNGYCYIKSTLGEVYLEVAGNSTANNTNVRIASFTGNNNQKWKFTPA